MTAGQIKYWVGAAALHDELSKARWLLADRGCRVAYTPKR
ncbi:hypothetical protein FHS96_003904 [Sphingomonas zeicaulis]